MTDHVGDGQINAGRQMAVVLDYLNAGSRLEHDDHVTLIEHLRRRVDRNTCYKTTVNKRVS